MTVRKQQEDLMQAIKYGQYVRVDQLLRNGCDPNWCVNNSECTPFLTLAVTQKKFLYLQLLLKHGASVDASDRSGMTAAMYASERGFVNFLHFLVENNADIKKVNNEGVNSLMLAAQWNHFDCVEYLLQCGANINHQDNNGKTALMLAAIHGNADCIHSLIDVGANLNVSDSVKGFTALMYALEHRKVDCATVLLQRGAEVNIKGTGREHETTALTLAFRNSKEIGEYLMIEKLLLNGADMTLSKLDQDFLHEMIARNKKKIVRLMVMNGCPPFDRRCWEHCFKFSEHRIPISPLCVALLSGLHDIAKYFITNCFLTRYDGTTLPNDASIRRKLHERGEMNNEAIEILTLMTSSPQTLRRLSFVTISEMINKAASTTGRRYKIINSGLPKQMQSDLLFSGIASRICFLKWHELSLEDCQMLEKCTGCSECSGNGFRLKKTQRW